MTRYLTAAQVGRINQRYGGGGLTPMNSAGVDAAVARPASGFGDAEMFPTIWLKAGALLHGLCSTQYFVDGNKRTAWMSAIVFLRAACPENFTRWWDSIVRVLMWSHEPQSFSYEPSPPRCPR